MYKRNNENTDQPIYTGRNGVFVQTGIEVMTLNGKIMLTAMGKRGAARCDMQIPTESIPALIKALKQQTKQQ